MRLPTITLLLLTQFTFGQTPIPSSQLRGLPGPKWIWTADWSLSNDLIALAGDDSLLRIYNGTTLELERAWKLPGMVKCVRWNSDGRHLAVGMRSGGMILDIQTGQSNLLVVDGSRALAWSPDNQRLAVADHEIKIWSIDGKLLETIPKGDR